jgi:hypothetical protein
LILLKFGMLVLWFECPFQLMVKFNCYSNGADRWTGWCGPEGAAFTNRLRLLSHEWVCYERKFSLLLGVLSLAALSGMRPPLSCYDTVRRPPTDVAFNLGLPGLQNCKNQVSFPSKFCSLWDGATVMQMNQDNSWLGLSVSHLASSPCTWPGGTSSASPGTAQCFLLAGYCVYRPRL